VESCYEDLVQASENLVQRNAAATLAARAREYGVYVGHQYTLGSFRKFEPLHAYSDNLWDRRSRSDYCFPFALAQHEISLAEGLNQVQFLNDHFRSFLTLAPGICWLGADFDFPLKRLSAVKHIVITP